MPSLRDQLQPTVDHAIRLHQQGQIAAAEQIYRQVIAQDPGNPDALHLLGLIAQEAGQLGLAVELMNRAIASEPRIPLYRMNLAKVYRGANRLEEALACATRAAELNPGFVEAHVERAACLKSLQRIDEAERAARQAAALGPNRPDSHGVLGNVLADRGLLDQAIAEYQLALRANPNFGEAVSNLGEALRKLGRYEEAERYFRQAVRLTPNVGEPHFNLAITLLARGQFEEGWREYEWRWRQIGVHGRRGSMWDGAALNGRSVLLYAEQGLGDTIQFIRYAPMLRERGAGRVVVECEQSLVSLIQTVEGVDEVVASTAAAQCDLICPIISLPHRLGTTLTTIPNSCPYVSVPAGRTTSLKFSKDALNVGLVWAGSAVHRNDCNRSTRLSDFAPLAQVPNVRLLSLQLGPPAQQLAEATFPIEDATTDIHDFTDTAALMAELDLIISVDTSPAHLAGALARPVWTIHPFVADFRWLLDRDDSPWYPTMRLFRQKTPGDWSGAIDKVAAALRQRP